MCKRLEPGLPTAKAPTFAPASAQVANTFVTNTHVVAGPPGVLDWRAVKSDDYKQYVANLRAVGCPKKTIRDVIVADAGLLSLMAVVRGTGDDRELTQPARRQFKTILNPPSAKSAFKN